jgi:predicted amidohydrolase
MVVYPDGRIANQAERNKEGVIYTTIDTNQEFIDPSKYGRDRVRELYPNGILK